MWKFPSLFNQIISSYSLVCSWVEGNISSTHIPTGQQPALAFPHPREGGCGAAQSHRVLPGSASPPRPHAAHQELTVFSRRFVEVPCALKGAPRPCWQGWAQATTCPRSRWQQEELRAAPGDFSFPPFTPLMVPLPLAAQGAAGTEKHSLQELKRRKVQFVDCTNTTSKPTAGTTELEHRTNPPDQKNNWQWTTGSTPLGPAKTRYSLRKRA